MPESNWRTYRPYQAEQVKAGLQILLDKGLLDEEDQKAATRIISKLRGLERWTQDYGMVSLTDREDQLLSQVEATLWR